MNTFQRKRLSLSVAALCLTSFGVSAQPMLEEVIVVAQKRSQSLQDVPIAVTAFTGSQLQKAAVQDIYDIQNNTPSLRVNQGTGNGTSSFSIRGVGTSSYNASLESSVGLYVDGVYRSRQGAMIGDMVDMGSVEVLRGPQGTLFGKNTPSGAILFNTKAPDHEPDGFVSVTAGNYGTMNASAAGNWSVIDDVLAVRGSVYSSARDGYVELDNIGEETHDKDRWGGRLQALYTPTNSLSIRVIADYAKIDEQCCSGIQFLDNLEATDRTNPDGSPVFGSDNILAALGGTTAPGDLTDTYKTQVDFAPTSSSEDGGVSIEVNWDFNDYATLTSITGYRTFDSDSTSDNDFTDIDILGGANEENLKAFSQELRVSYSGKRLNAVAGLYYFEQEIETSADTRVGEQFDIYASKAEGYDEVVDGLQQVSDLTGGTLILPPAEGFPRGMVANNFGEQDQRSLAVFAQGEYNLTDVLILTVGLRYTDEKKDLQSTFTESLNGIPFEQPLQADARAAGDALMKLSEGDFSPLGNPEVIANFNAFSNPGWATGLFNGISPRDDIDVTLEDEQLTGSIKLSGWVSNDILLYTSYTTGYKSGGTNTARLPEGVDPIYDAETPESFEVGVKSEFPEHALRLNVAAYYTTVDDFQADAFTGTAFILSNAGELETYGVEAEVFWQPTNETTVSLIYAYNSAEYKDYENGQCWVATPWQTGKADPGAGADSSCDRSGDRLVGQPEHLATLGVRRDISFSDNIEGSVYGEYSYITDMIQGDNADPLKTQDDYGLLNLRATVSFINYDVDVIAWGRNVLNEDYVGSIFDSPLQPGKLSAIVGAPRTYGITVMKRF